MGRGEAAEKLSPEEDPRTSTKRGLPCAGISPRTTMRQGVDQPCGIRGSWGIYNPKTSPPSLWHGASTTLHRHRAAAAAAEAAALAGRKGEGGRWQTG